MNFAVSFNIRTRLQASGSPQNRNRQVIEALLLHHSHNSTHAVCQAIGQLQELLMLHINLLYLIWSLIIYKNTNEIPLLPFTIQDTTIPTSEL